MASRLLSFLGLARKAGKLSMGIDPSIESMAKKKAELLIFSSDISENSVSKALKVANENRIPVLVLNGSMSEIEWNLGKKAGVITVNDRGFAERIKKLYTETQGG